MTMGVDRNHDSSPETPKTHLKRGHTLGLRAEK